jgi:hypothetical protein
MALIRFLVLIEGYLRKRIRKPWKDITEASFWMWVESPGMLLPLKPKRVVVIFANTVLVVSVNRVLRT